MTDSRAVVLGRVAAALGRSPAGRTEPAAVARSVTRSYRTGDDRAGAELVTLFAERVRDYGASVTVVDAGGAAAAVAACAGAGAVLAAPALPGEWLAALAEAGRDDPPRPVAELTEVDTAVTACAVAVAETGTIVLDHGADQGRRALTLVPDHHVCVVTADQLVATVPQAVRRLRPGGILTWISGPSATSDIELSRVAGVHGPRRLDVVMVTG
jgi:L-lactate dehydrogenase complex protein LldG